MRRQTGLIALVCTGLAVAASTLPLAASSSVGAASLHATSHTFRSWTEGRAQATARALSARPSTTAVTLAQRIAFSNRASAAIPALQAELGPRFISAAIDPTVGNRLVVHVTGADVQSATLAALDGNGGEVRVVTDPPSTLPLADAFAAARALLGTTIGGAKVVSVVEDDMAGTVEVGVTRITPAVSRRFATDKARFVLRAAPELHATDGGATGTWGSNAARNATPVAGGDSLRPSATGECTSAFPATRNGVNVLITAGHCGATGTLYKLGKNSTTTIGTVAVSHSNDSTGVDAAAITNTTGTFRNCVITTGSTCKTISFQARTILAGTPITKIGSTTGSTAGTVVHPNVAFTATAPTISVTSGIQTTACSLPGDSGGPLLVTNADGTVTPIGTLSAGSSSSCTAGFLSSFQNWQVACPVLGVDNCPVPQATVASSWALRGILGSEEVYSENSLGAEFSNTALNTATWQGWSPTPTAVIGYGANADLGAARVVVNALHEDMYTDDIAGHIWAIQYTPGTGWGPWTNLGWANGSIELISPFAIEGITGTEDVFALDLQGNVWENSLTVATGARTGWTELPAPGGVDFAFSLTAVRGFSQRVGGFSWNSENLYASDVNNGQIWQNSFLEGGAGWQGWVPIGANFSLPTGVMLHNETAVIGPQGGESVTAQDGNGQIWQTSFVSGGYWNAWTNLGAPAGFALGEPNVTVVPGVNASEVILAEDTTPGDIWMKTYVVGTGWGAWTNLGKPATAALYEPVLRFSTTGIEYIVAKDPTGAVWQNTFLSNAWQGWVSLGAPPRE